MNRDDKLLYHQIHPGKLAARTARLPTQVVHRSRSRPGHLVLAADIASTRSRRVRDPDIASLCSLIGCAIDREAQLDEVDQSSICGPTDDARFVNSYDGTLGPSTGFTGQLVGVHTLSGGNASGTNSGIRIARIRAVSSVL